MVLFGEKQGAEEIQIIELDGAKTGDSENRMAIQNVAKAVSIPIQVGGGIRSMDIIAEHIRNGVSRIIIGTAAITNRPFLKEAVAKNGDKIAVSIDARNGFVATVGWTEPSNTKAIDHLKDLEEIAVNTIVYTEI